MGQQLHYYPVMGFNGKQVHIFKFARDDVGAANSVEEIATKAKSTLRGGDYSPGHHGRRTERSSEVLGLASQRFLHSVDSSNPWKERLGPGGP